MKYPNLYKKVANRAFEAAEADKSDLEQWRKDLDQMEKLFFSIPTTDTPEAVDQYLEVKRAFKAFGNNLENWLDDLIVDRYSGGVGKIHTKFLRKKNVIQEGEGVFPLDDARNPDPSKLGQEGHAPYFDVYREAVEQTFDNIEKILDAYDGSVEIPNEPYSMSVSGVRVTVHDVGRAKARDEIKEDLDHFVRNIEVIFDRIRRQGFGKALEGLEVNLKYKVDTLMIAKGVYYTEEDVLDIFPQGFKNDDRRFGGTLIHEIGHRFYYQVLSSQARKHWEQVVGKNLLPPVETTELLEFYELYKEQPANSGALYDVIEKNTDDVEKQLKYKVLADTVFDWFGSRHESLSFKQYNKLLSLDGKKFPVNSISPYGDSSPTEGWAEAFRLYINRGPRALTPWTRQFFEKVARQGRVSSLAKKVARRALEKRADVFQAPPGLLADVTNFVIPTWASWVLDKAERKIKMVQEKMKNAHPMMAGNLDDQLVEAHLIKKQASKYTRQIQQPQGSETKKIEIDLTGWKYLESYYGDLRQIMGQQLKKIRGAAAKGRELIEAESMSRDHRLHTVAIPYLKLDGRGRLMWRWAVAEIFMSLPGEEVVLQRINQNTTKPEVNWAAQDIRLKGTPSDIYQEFMERVVQPTLRAQLKAMDAYQDPIELAEAVLKGQGLYEILATVIPTSHSNEGGHWDRSRLELVAYCPAKYPTSVKYFETLRKRYMETVRHECVHVAQDVMKVLKNLNDLGGLGDRESKNPQFNSAGQEIKENGKIETERRPHALREVEFQPRLQDEIGRFNTKTEQLPHKFLNLAAHLWTGSKDKNDLEDVRLDPEDMLRIRKALTHNMYGGTEFFKMLKEHEPKRWRKAVKEFIEQVL